jgi:hypothetical protein
MYLVFRLKCFMSMPTSFAGRRISESTFPQGKGHSVQTLFPFLICPVLFSFTLFFVFPQTVKVLASTEVTLLPLTFFILFVRLYITYVRFDVLKHTYIYIYMSIFSLSPFLSLSLSFSYMNKFFPFFDQLIIFIIEVTRILSFFLKYTPII